MEFGFHFPTKIRFGRGAVQNNGAALRLGERAFIVTGKHSGRASGALADVIAALTHQKIECSVFEGIGNNPDVEQCRAVGAQARAFHADFIIGIGGALRSGKPHDGRSPDYDDWTMNGDILFWNDLLGCAFELSSMGIRVDPESLDRQLTISGCDDRRKLTYHKMLLAGELPLTIGGGIGQSRLSMLLLGKAHVGEVQASVWDDETTAACEKAGIRLL